MQDKNNIENEPNMNPVLYNQKNDPQTAISLTPSEIVKELDRYIVGQTEAKKSVALALRNRWRRQQLKGPMRDEVLPKNILMIGPTGVGKTEIARRLANLTDAPFIKVEATKFTEIGYVGRDVEQIIRDLVELAIKKTRDNMKRNVLHKAGLAAEQRILNALRKLHPNDDELELTTKLRKGHFDHHEIELNIVDKKHNPFQSMDIPGMPGAQMGMLNLGEMFNKTFGTKMKTRKIKVMDAIRLTIEEESDKLLDQEKMVEEAIHNCEQSGIVFIDEIDKICVREGRSHGDVSREGVQRDLLPLIEGTTVSTKHGSVQTDHILFITSGAFHLSRPSDLLPELQGRLPIRVELADLDEKDLIRILKEPESSLLKQYIALLHTEGVELQFTEDGIEKMAQIAFNVNRDVENIGARRLHTILEKLLEEISFHAPNMQGKTVVMDKQAVEKKLLGLVEKVDLQKFIL